MTSSPITTGRLVQVAFHVQDLQRAKAFYVDLLGLPVLFEADTLLVLEAGTTRILISIADGNERHCAGSILYFETESLDDSYHRLRVEGVTLVREPQLTHRTPTHELWMAFVEDPFGQLVGLQETRAAVATE